MGKVTSEIPVFQIVGYKKCGKTIFIKQLVKKFTKQGVRVGVIKHHGHGGAPEIIEPEHTDTAQFEKEGACATAVEGDGVLHLKVSGTTSISIQQIVAMYKLLPLDLILIEGYKQASYPKLVMIKEMGELDRLLGRCEHVEGIIDNLKHGMSLTSVNLPIFKFRELDAVIDYMMTELR